MTDPTIVYAGDRDIAVDVLEFLVEQDARIEALLLHDDPIATHSDQLRDICDDIRDERVLVGEQFRTEAGRELLEEIEPDYILSIHFHYIYPASVLEIPGEGVVNLHPAYLPYNRGWHTPSWAIWDETPYGATLHFMNEDIDAGEIIAKKKIEIRPDDTADTLYAKAKRAETQLFEETWPELSRLEYETTPQSDSEATTHTADQLSEIQEIELDPRAERLVRRLRALTTNDVSEAAYFERDGTRYRVQVEITPEGEIEE